MTSGWQHASIGLRLTVWYAMALTVMLVVYASTTYLAVRHEFEEQLEEQLHDAAAPGVNGESDRQSAEEHLRAQMREVLVVLALGLPLVVILAGAGGYVLARRALAPIDQLGTEARRVTAENLHERLTVMNPTDDGRLTAVINDTLARLDASFNHLRRFTADASHELRTPLAVVRGIGESVVAEPRSRAEYEESIGSMLEEVNRMTRLVDTLLRLARGDAKTIRLSYEEVRLDELARDVMSALAVLAEERRQTFTLDVAEKVVVSVDRLVLREAISNVLDNAIKYSPSGSTIALRVSGSADRAVLAIGDQGPGIADEHRERIFDRFFRVDEGRSREQGGVGLGLAIAKWAIETHGGSISVHSGMNGGSEFRIVLPLNRAEDGRSIVEDTR